VTTYARPNRRIDRDRANALAPLAQAGDRDALEELACEMYGLVEAIAYKRGWFVTGGEVEDLVQEGIKNLQSILRQWDQSQASWTGYAGMAIARDMVEAMIRERRVKHMLHHAATSLDVMVGPNEGATLATLIPDLTGADPADAMPCDGNWVLAAVQWQPSRLQAIAMNRCVIGGEDYRPVSLTEGIAYKSLDNAVQRVRRRAIRRLVEMADSGELDEDTAARVRRLERRRIERTGAM
jgi:RNA polymerase sporulation-specific sigma factor